MLTKESRVLFSVRSDAHEKNGGDYQLMQLYSREVGRYCQTEIVRGVPSNRALSGASLVVCTNLDRPVEPYFTLKACKRLGVPFLLYALHHPDEGLRSYLGNGTRGLKRIVARLAGNDPRRYEMSMWLLRVFATAIRRRQILPIASVAGAQKAILRDAAAIAVCAEREAEQIGLDISPISRACVVPHISDFTSPMNVTTQLGLIVVPGRIEARKNQIAALRIAQHFPELTFLFVGALSPYEKRYVAEFLLTLGQTANARHVAALPKEEFYPVLSSAELVLNASFFEVTSLIDLYCIENSIPLVTTLHTYARASGAFRVFDPMSVGEGVRALRECLVQSRQDGRKITSAKENNSMSIVELIEGLL